MSFFHIPRTNQICPFDCGFPLEQNSFTKLISANSRHGIVTYDGIACGQAPAWLKGELAERSLG